MAPSSRPLSLPADCWSEIASFATTLHHPAIFDIRQIDKASSTANLADSAFLAPLAIVAALSQETLLFKLLEQVMVPYLCCTIVHSIIDGVSAEDVSSFKNLRFDATVLDT